LERINPDELTLKDKVVYINRVAKVVKGGKRFSFSAVVVVGDGQGCVGVGKGKAAEVPEAIRKAVEHAKKSLMRVPIKDETIPYEVVGRCGAEHIMMKPASEGTGIIAGGAASVMEISGIRNILCKSLGSGNPYNVVKATLNGLTSLRAPELLARMRQVEPDGVGV
jgi:small subunit ribosomal protein S5